MRTRIRIGPVRINQCGPETVRIGGISAEQNQLQRERHRGPALNAPPPVGEAILAANTRRTHAHARAHAHARTHTHTRARARTRPLVGTSVPAESTPSRGGQSGVHVSVQVTCAVRRARDLITCPGYCYLPLLPRGDQPTSSCSRPKDPGTHGAHLLRQQPAASPPNKYGLCPSLQAGRRPAHLSSEEPPDTRTRETIDMTGLIPTGAAMGRRSH